MAVQNSRDTQNCIHSEEMWEKTHILHVRCVGLGWVVLFGLMPI